MTEAGIAPKQISCDECRELLSEYVDREIDPAAREVIEHHLGTCTRCVTESTRLQGLKKIIQHWDGVKGSGEFRKSVMQKMIRESQQVPAGQFNEAADSAKRERLAEDEIPDEPKRIPPVWVLIAAAVLAVVAYYAVLKIRGL